jgi:membrane protein YdbS with pleckstrin-like domain
MIEDSFTNDQVFQEAIPKVEHIVFQELERSYLKVNMIVASIFCLIFLAAASIVIYRIHADDKPQFVIYIIATVYLVLAGLILFLSYKGYFMKAYALRQNDIIYKSGYIWRSRTVIPFNRVQHCEINNGPIDRMFNLSSLKLYTAGGSSSDLTIPGLNPQLAQDLKDFIVKKTGLYEEE